MKKALLVAPLLGVAGWAGATMYAGQETQSAYDQLLDQLRVQHGLNVEPMEYEKNFLSSKVKTIVNTRTGTLSQTQDLPAPLLVMGDQFVLTHEIEHGPVVLSNGLKALASQIKTTLDLDSVEPEFAKAWKNACACEEPVVLLSEITLQGEYSHAFTMNALESQDGQTKYSFGGIQSNTHVNADKIARSTGQMGALYLQSEELEMDLAAGQWEMDGHEALKNIIVGEAVVNWPSMNIKGAEGGVELSGLQFDLKSDVTNGKLNSYGDFSIASLVAPFVELSDTHFDVAVTGLDANNLTEMSEKISKLDLSSQGQNAELLNLYKELLVPGVGIRYGLNGEHTSGGAFDASIELAYQPAEGKTFDDMHTVADLVNASLAEAKVNFDQQLLAHLPPQASQNPMLAFGFSQAGDKYSLNASLKEGIAELNGEPMPLAMMFAEQLAQPLPSAEEVAMMMQAQ